MPSLTIYELDPTGGFCGFPAEIPGLPPADAMRQELIRRNKIIKNLENQQNIVIKRVFLRSPGSKIDNTHIISFLKEEGSKAFPIFLYRGKIIHSGSFPDFETLSQKLIEPEDKG